MSLTNPPPAVTAFRDMLLGCPSLITYGVVTGTIWYPAASPTPDAGTGDTLPLVVISEGDSSRTRYAEGAGGLPTGSLTATVQAVDTVENLEVLGRAVCKELQELQTGLYIAAASTQLAGRASLAAEAQSDTDSGANMAGININVSYGLGA